jgi:hypothetical protein
MRICRYRALLTDCREMRLDHLEQMFGTKRHICQGAIYEKCGETVHAAGAAAGEMFLYTLQIDVLAHFSVEPIEV